jgi:hypothetical protein
VWVDDEQVASGSLAGNALPAQPRGLLLGGPGAAATQLAALNVSTAGFTGTIGDLIVDHQ